MPVDYIRAASWETEGPPEPLGPPTSPMYRQQSAEDVRTYSLNVSLNVSRQFDSLCYFSVLWASLLELS